MTRTISTFLSILLIQVGSYFRTDSQVKSSQVFKDTVALTLTVTDKKDRLIGGLQRADFTVLVDQRPVDILSLSKGDPASVGILFDSSASVMSDTEKVNRQRREEIMDGLAHFIAESNPANEYFLVGFGRSAELLVDWTSDPHQIFEGVKQISKAKDTALYDSIVVGLDKLNEGHKARHALILISDGQDNVSKQKFSNLRDLLKRSDALLYSIGLTDEALAGSSLGMEGQGVLDELSTVSGATALFSHFGNRKVRMNEMFSFVATEMSNQYCLVVRVNAVAERERWHKVEVNVVDMMDSAGSKRSLRVKTKSGFFLN